MVKADQIKAKSEIPRVSCDIFTPPPPHPQCLLSTSHVAPCAEDKRSVPDHDKITPVT